MHIKKQPQTFERFNAAWTPTTLVLDADGTERHRIEGFLPADDFLAQLGLGLGKLHFHHGQWKEAEKALRPVCELVPPAGATAEACYWAGVVAYKGSNDAKHLGATAKVLAERVPDNEWARKASVWKP